jgi:hypothetical protein
VKTSQKIWTLYCHTHVESGRRYIGLTFQTMEKRWKKHIYAAFRFSKGGRWHFPNAIRKYGPNAFSHEVLAQSWTLEGANATEEELILQYETRNPEKGFNLAKGGGVKPNPDRKNPWDRPEYRAKIIPSLKKLAQDPQVRAAAAAGATEFNRSHPELIARRVTAAAAINTGRQFSEERRMEISYYNTGRVHNSEVKLKISKAHKGRQPSVLAIRNSVESRFLKAMEPKTGMNCSRHGFVPITDCHKYTKPNGLIRLKCKLCDSIRHKVR